MKLPDAEFNQLMFMKEILNETEARKINVYLNVGKPKADNKLYLKVKTRLFEDIFAELHRQNPSITKEDCKGNSRWFPFDKTLMYEIFEYIRKYKKYIKYIRENGPKSSNHNAPTEPNQSLNSTQIKLEI